jgi:hypothetical protein
MGLAGNSVVGVEQTMRPAAIACGEATACVDFGGEATACVEFGGEATACVDFDRLWFDCDMMSFDFGAPESCVSAQELSEAQLAPEPECAEAAAAATAVATAAVAVTAPLAAAGLPIYTKATLSPAVHFAYRKACRAVLKGWFMEHLAHPYVTKQSDFDNLQSETSLCRSQIINWFCNERLRNKEYRAFKAGQPVVPSSVPEPKLLQRTATEPTRVQRAETEPGLLQRAATESKPKRAPKRQAASLGGDAPTPGAIKRFASAP